ncbi:hypothetical protein YC2023_082703 [Brassica napus]
MASAQVKRRQEAGRRKLEEFRKQKAEREKKNNTAQPVDNTVADSDGEVVVASISNGPLSQSPETSSFNQTQSKSKSKSYDGSSKERSKRDESVGTSSSLDLRGSSNDFREKQSSGDFNRASTLTELIISSRKDSRESGGSSIVQKPTLSNSYLFSSPDTSSRPYSPKNEATVKRNRPSFLDSLNISRASEIPETSSGSQLTVGGPSPLQYISRKSDRSDSPYPYDSFRSPSFPVANGVMPGFTDYSIPKQNDDFSSLEQHIEDLTQEKFSLQRDLDASRALAESLASENSSMTDTYNQQRSIVNQLKDDMEKLHQQIQAQMGELESVRNDYANAQLECNAADERSQILASEVISLEDKALRLRSNELKLERELESAQAEMSSYKKKLQSLEKDRQDLQSTIKALQEEKKVLQTMVQKASSGGKSTALDKSSTSSKNASTSTEGLAISDTMTGSSNQETDSTDLLGSYLSNTAIIHETGQLTLEGFPLSVPADQMRLIENINTLIAEVVVMYYLCEFIFFFFLFGYL